MRPRFDVPRGARNLDGPHLSRFGYDPADGDPAMVHQSSHADGSANLRLRHARTDAPARRADEAPGLLPVAGSVLMVLGVILVAAGAPVFADTRGLHSETRARGERDVAMTSFVSIRIGPTWSLQAWNSPAIARSALRPGEQPRSPRAQEARRVSSDALPGDGDRVRNPVVSDEPIPKSERFPNEARDARWGLIEMANAQRGHWAKLCPCPVYAPDTKLGPN